MATLISLSLSSVSSDELSSSSEGVGGRIAGGGGLPPGRAGPGAISLSTCSVSCARPDSAYSVGVTTFSTVGSTRRSVGREDCSTS